MAKPPPSNERAARLTQDLNDQTEDALSALEKLIRSEKSKGHRLLFRNGESHIGVFQTVFIGGTVTRRLPGVLSPEAPLVLSDSIKDWETRRLYVGDKKWFIGAMTLALAIHGDRGSDLSVVSREEAAIYVQQTQQMVQEVTAFPGDFS
jgi:hypothetical protein